jgi:hypothetical protein
MHVQIGLSSEVLVVMALNSALTLLLIIAIIFKPIRGDNSEALSEFLIDHAREKSARTLPFRQVHQALNPERAVEAQGEGG